MFWDIICASITINLSSCILLPSSLAMTERSDHAMEAARAPSSLEEFVGSSIQRMDQQEKNLNDTARAVQALVTQVSELTQQVQLLRGPAAPPTPTAPTTPPDHDSQSEPRLPVPGTYGGEPNFCRTFLTRCSMHFALQSRTFATEAARVAFVLTLLTGRQRYGGRRCGRTPIHAASRSRHSPPK